MPAGHLYVSDLDGTLVRSDTTLSPESRELLNRSIDEGALFTVASARSVHAMKPMLAGLRLRLPIIEFNGAFVTDFETGRHEIVHALDAGVAEAAYALFARDAVPPLVSTYDGERDSVYHGATHNDGIRSYLEGRDAAGDPRMRPVADPRRHLDEQVVCLTVIDRREALEALLPAVRDQFADRAQLTFFPDYFEPWWWLTLQAPGATKAQAIQRVLARCGLGAESLVVFGDQVNDISMFEIAGHAVAVENAIDAVKARAQEIIGSNESDSVAKFIARHWSASS